MKRGTILVAVATLAFALSQPAFAAQKNSSKKSQKRQATAQQVKKNSNDSFKRMMSANKKDQTHPIRQSFMGSH